MAEVDARAAAAGTAAGTELATGATTATAAPEAADRRTPLAGSTVAMEPSATPLGWAAADSSQQALAKSPEASEAVALAGGMAEALAALVRSRLISATDATLAAAATVAAGAETAARVSSPPPSPSTLDQDRTARSSARPLLVETLAVTPQLEAATVIG